MSYATLAKVRNFFLLVWAVENDRDKTMNKIVLIDFLPLNVRVTKEMIEIGREVLGLSNG